MYYLGADWWALKKQRIKKRNKLVLKEEVFRSVLSLNPISEVNGVFSKQTNKTHQLFFHLSGTNKGNSNRLYVWTAPANVSCLVLESLGDLWLLETATSEQMRKVY